MAGLMGLAGLAQAAEPMPAASQPEARWNRVQKLYGRITANELGLVINTADPYSVAIGERHFTVTDARYLDLETPVGLRLPLDSLHLFPSAHNKGGPHA